MFGIFCDIVFYIQCALQLKISYSVTLPTIAIFSSQVLSEVHQLLQMEFVSFPDLLRGSGHETKMECLLLFNHMTCACDCSVVE